MHSANVRICIFDVNHRNHGLGTFAMASIVEFAFTHTSLLRIGLEVFAYNKRALQVYEKVGFIQEGRLRNTILNKGKLDDIICMSILKEEYKVS